MNAPAGPACAVLYSGGTDSTCVAALWAERFPSVHLLTFEERGTAGSPVPTGNADRLRARFPGTAFTHAVLPVDGILRKVSYGRYWSCLRRHGMFMVSTPGFSTLSWHVRAIAYCLDHGIAHAADGVTRELMHFPGHMDGILAEFRLLYRRFGIEYENPVRSWAVPRDQQFIDRLVVDHHGFALEPTGAGEAPPARTTGRRLHELGLLPHPNVKGSDLDRAMQHSCYPFVLFNIFVFWYYLPFHDEARYAECMLRLFREKAADAGEWLEEYRARGKESALASWIR